MLQRAFPVPFSGRAARAHFRGCRGAIVSSLMNMANKATRAGSSVVSGPGVRWMEHVSIVSCSTPGGAGVRPSY